MDGWWSVLGIVAALVVGCSLFLRSVHRWRQPRPTTPDAQPAEIDRSIRQDTGGV